jgi:hypothetical protein
MFLRKISLFWVIIIGIFILITGCTSSQKDSSIQSESEKSQEQPKAQEITFEQLKANHEKYQGKFITITGYIFWGWEWCFLSEDYEFVEKGYYKSKGEMIDIKGLEKNVEDSLYLQHPSGARDYFGKLRLTGHLGYGPVPMRGDGYYIELVPNGAEIVPWSPPVLPYAEITKE